MQERSDRLDFYIRDQSERPPLTEPHRHDYFQIQVNLAGDTVQHIGGAVRPFTRGMLAFILPHRLHMIPHPPGGRFVVVNFSQAFLRRDLLCDPLDLEDVPLAEAPELAPFRFQEYQDFTVPEAEMPELLVLLEKMRTTNRQRGLGSAELLRGCLLQLIGGACLRHEDALRALGGMDAQRAGRRDALKRVRTYIAAHLGDPALSQAGAAQAAFLSPNYLAHLLRKETGRTFTDLVLERRMALAQSLLAGTGRRIGDIAHACGFADEAYFSRRFRLRFGVSPRGYRSAVHPINA
ncbi:MAG TPA: AraC family transcriptional regulator [Burkholderiaceae bacterium]